MILIGGPAEPLQGLGVVLGHALTLGVHHAENRLRFGAALICGSLEPVRSLGVVFRHAMPAAMHHAENELSDREAPIGQGASERIGRFIVSALKRRAGVRERPRKRGAGERKGQN